MILSDVEPSSHDSEEEAEAHRTNGRLEALESLIRSRCNGLCRQVNMKSDRVVLPSSSLGWWITLNGTPKARSIWTRLAVAAFWMMKEGCTPSKINFREVLKSHHNLNALSSLTPLQFREQHYSNQSPPVVFQWSFNMLKWLSNFSYQSNSFITLPALSLSLPSEPYSVLRLPQHRKPTNFGFFNNKMSR